MYLSLNNTLTGGRAGWPKLAEIAAQVGFPAVDLATKPAMAAGFETTKQLLAGLKIKPGITDFPVEFRKDDAAFRADLEKLPDAAQFCAALGCPRMTTYIMSSSPKPKAELRKIYKDRFRASADILARSHVRLGLEFLGPLHIRKANPYEFIWRMDEMLEFAKECGSNVGLLLDSWHWYHAGATPEDIIAAGKDRIIHVQINDSPKLPPEQIRDNERLLPGEGVINLQAFLKALKKIGYNDALSPEVFGRGLKEMPMEEGARLGLESTRKVLAAMEPRA
jgi:sugar phosphate isomerase/epimerase